MKDYARTGAVARETVTVEVMTNLDEAGTAYYLVAKTSADANVVDPTPAQVKACALEDGSGVVGALPADDALYLGLARGATPSAGAVCTTLLYAAQSFGYAAQWLTEWYAYDDDMLAALGGEPGHDQIAGFIYIGEKIKAPMERTRPDPDKVITYL